MIHETSNPPSAFRQWLWVMLFSMAFAWVESAVVVYLREIYFDGGFSFPLTVNWQGGTHVIDPLVRIEFGREIATIIMLIAIGWAAGRNSLQKFCYFMIAFGIWDIFYYVWLYVMVGWPESLMTWDLLFYVPLPWVGPVVAPVLIALTMILAGTVVVYFDQSGVRLRWRWYDMAVELACAVLMIVAFCWDWKNILQVPGDPLRTGIPNTFAWWLYLPAYLFALTYFIFKLRRMILETGGHAARLEKEIDTRTSQLKNQLFERELAEDMLRKSEQYFRSILFSLHDDILVIGKDHRVTDVNKAFIQVFQTDRNQIIGRHLHELSPTFKERFQTDEEAPLFEAVFKSGRSVTYRIELACGSEATVWVDILISPLKTAEGEISHAIMAIRDVSQEVELEHQLHHTQKMDAIGTLAGGIAHDFNNVLMSIIMNIEFVLRKRAFDDPIAESLQLSLKAAYRARDLVEQILTFGRRGEVDLHRLSVIPLIKESLKMLRSSLPTTINISQHIDVTSDTVLATPTLIHQILINLCTNAAQAMTESGGTITISLTELDLTVGGAGKYYGVKPGTYLRLTVSDTGCGIASHIRDKIFEPFFTTKKVGEGTGMGLAVVHGIVENLRGAITIKSVPDRGAEFQVLLPRADSPQAPSVEQPSRPVEGSGRVLVVDDDKMVAQSMDNALTDLGYQVTSVTSSIHALYEFQNNPGAFDIVVTDYTMPNMTGLELTREILSIRPEIPIILCSGYDEPVSALEAKEEGIWEFVSKPVATAALAELVASLLKRSNG